MAKEMASAPVTDRAHGSVARPRPSPRLESRVTGRLATIGLLLVLIVLTGFAIVSALRTDMAAGAAARSTGLNDLYWQARYAVASEESLERKYRLEPSPDVLKDYSTAAGSFVSAIQRVARDGGAEDRALSADLLVRQRAYRQAAGQLFAAVDAGHEARVFDIDRAEVDPRSGAIKTLVLAAADKHHREALASVRSLEQIQRVSLIGTPIAFACGLLLLAVFSIVLVRQRRRADTARRDELEAETEASAALAASNERLRELDRQKDEFVASVSHELRTPLTSIRGYLAMMLDGGVGTLTDEQESFLATIERNSKRLLGLVGDLLDVAQLETGTLSLERSHHDLAAIAAESVSSASLVAEERGVALTLHAEEVPGVEIDPVRFAQVIDSLLSNALKFTPPGGSVEVRLSCAGELAMVGVADTGIGMSASEQAQVFKRFYRAESAVKQAVRGTGLGLWISKSIVEAHGGTLGVTGATGLGTIFTIELPLTPAVPIRPFAAVSDGGPARVPS
jgi:signal transduction histidine kinase